MGTIKKTSTDKIKNKMTTCKLPFFYNSKAGNCRFDTLEGARASAGITANIEKRSIVIMEQWYSPKRGQDVILFVAAVSPSQVFEIFDVLRLSK